MAEEETDGIPAMGHKLGGDNDSAKESLVSSSSPSPSPSPSSVSQENQTSMVVQKGKSCKGCLYYSSAIKSKTGNPLCVGLTRSLPSVPRYIVGESEIEAAKKGRALRDFKYGCLGYSVYPDWKDHSPDIKDSKTELPVCVGLEMLADRRPAAADSASTQPLKQDGTLTPTPAPAPAPAPALATGSRKPAPSFGSEFLTRFTRNAGLVAMGVAKNLKRVGNQIKDTVDDVLYPYRRRPK